METNPEVLAQSVKSGVERVRNSNKDYAFILESTMNEYFNQRRPCTTVKVCLACFDTSIWLNVILVSKRLYDYHEINGPIFFA